MMNDIFATVTIDSSYLQDLSLHDLCALVANLMNKGGISRHVSFLDDVDYVVPPGKITKTIITHELVDAAEAEPPPGSPGADAISHIETVLPRKRKQAGSDPGQDAVK